MIEKLWGVIENIISFLYIEYFRLTYQRKG